LQSSGNELSLSPRRHRCQQLSEAAACFGEQKNQSGERHKRWQERVRHGIEQWQEARDDERQGNPGRHILTAKLQKKRRRKNQQRQVMIVQMGRDENQTDENPDPDAR
jgi:hypothetical protein